MSRPCVEIVSRYDVIATAGADDGLVTPEDNASRYDVMAREHSDEGTTALHSSLIASK